MDIADNLDTYHNSGAPGVIAGLQQILAPQAPAKDLVEQVGHEPPLPDGSHLEIGVEIGMDRQTQEDSGFAGSRLPHLIRCGSDHVGNL